MAGQRPAELFLLQVKTKATSLSLHQTKCRKSTPVINNISSWVEGKDFLLVASDHKLPSSAQAYGILVLFVVVSFIFVGDPYPLCSGLNPSSILRDLPEGSLLTKVEWPYGMLGVVKLATRKHLICCTVSTTQNLWEHITGTTVRVPHEQLWTLRGSTSLSILILGGHIKLVIHIARGGPEPQSPGLEQ